ncbi:MAG: rRNA maturation RNase YbeY [Candidatus Limnocylindrales bacterium]
MNDRAHYLGPWRVDLEVRPGVDLPASRSALVRLVGLTLDAAGAPRPASIGLILSDDRELTGLNQVHMARSDPTDVLSFPLLPTGAYPWHPGRADDPGARSGPPFRLPPGVRRHLGDIVVSVERAAEQAATGRGGQAGDRRWSAADELRLLVVHGVLHVCGWDHADPAEGTAMRALEWRLLESSA